MGVSIIRIIVFGVYIGVPLFRETTIQGLGSGFRVSVDLSCLPLTDRTSSTYSETWAVCNWLTVGSVLLFDNPGNPEVL